jgi:hypothetical protein
MKDSEEMAKVGLLWLTGPFVERTLLFILLCNMLVAV